MPPFADRGESHVRLQRHTGTVRFLFASLSFFSFPRFDLGACSAPPLHPQLHLPALLRNMASIPRALHLVCKKPDLKWNFPPPDLTEPPPLPGEPSCCGRAASRRPPPTPPPSLQQAEWDNSPEVHREVNPKFNASSMQVRGERGSKTPALPPHCAYETEPEPKTCSLP